MKNIELKIKLNDNSRITSLLRKKKADFKGRLVQIDRYYSCEAGRLKLREINGKIYELIFYKRPDTKKSKISDYYVLSINPKLAWKIKSFFKNVFGEKVVVRKMRNLWVYKNTRIHLDKVNGLGNFMELETVVKNKNLTKAKLEHADVIKLLSLEKYRKIDKSYSDLLLKRK